MRLRPHLPLLIATALWQGGCAAPGTDLEALPFYREDRTSAPLAVSAEVPLLLLSLDAADVEVDPAEAGPVMNEDGEPTQPGEPYLEARSIVRWPWGFGRFIQRDEHLNYQLTIPFFAQGLVTSGPLGRALSPDEAVQEDIIASLADDPAGGGVAMGPLGHFYRQRTDHNALPDMEHLGPDLDEDIGLFPFFAWGGGSSEEHEYFAVFPFGGTTKGILGKEEITWFGFPLPAYAKVRDRAYDSTHIMWPFINWVDGPRHSGWRVLPFGGHYEHTDSWGNMVYERNFLLWPFITWQTSGMNEPKGPTDTFFFLPFGGWISGPDYRNYSVLWPFFRYEEDDLDESWELRAPFPFLIAGGGRDRWRFDLWPFFGAKVRPGFARHFVAWPIWRWEDLESQDHSFNGQWLLPFFWRTHWEWSRTGEHETKIRLFPLLHYREWQDGSLEFAMLSPYWFDDPNGFERTIGSFFRLYRYYQDEHGGYEHQALLGLFSYRNLPALPRTPDHPGRPDYWRLSLLFGLFQLRSLGDETGLRLLYLPEITWGERDPVMDEWEEEFVIAKARDRRPLPPPEPVPVEPEPGEPDERPDETDGSDEPDTTEPDATEPDATDEPDGADEEPERERVRPRRVN